VLKPAWLLLVFGVLACSPAHAQNFPSGPVRIIVPFPAGGATDVLGRVLSVHLQNLWGPPVVSEYRPGAAGLIGTRQLASSPADGYTLLMASTGAILALAGDRASSGSFDITRELAPVSLIAAPPYIVVVHPSLPVKTTAELIAYAKQNPGKLNYGSSGQGSTVHILTESLRHAAGIDIVHIPYRGAGPSITGLLAGDIEILMDTVVVPHVQSGKLIGLAAAGEERLPELPDLPTLAEAGYSNVRTSGWTALFGPGPLPKEIVDIYARNIEALFKDETFVKRIVTTGSKPAFLGPAAFADYVRQDNEYFGKVIRELKIKGQD
jgi:tripartite-type tricarboxylate transporter receptor subunit TctC